MTEFITRNYGNKNFEIIIKTDSKEHYKATQDFARGLIDHAKPAPTIEAKPVVHCKDCKYNVANSKHDPLDITDYTDITCEYFMTDGMSPNDYCSQGVKIPVVSNEKEKYLNKEIDYIKSYRIEEEHKYD